MTELIIKAVAAVVAGKALTNSQAADEQEVSPVRHAICLGNFDARGAICGVLLGALLRYVEDASLSKDRTDLMERYRQIQAAGLPTADELGNAWNLLDNE